MVSVFLYTSVLLGAVCIALWMYAYKLRITLDNERLLHMEQSRLSSDFENISYRILRQINEDGYVEKQEELRRIQTPLKDALSAFDRKVSDIEKERINAYSDLKRQITDLKEFNTDIREKTTDLVKALSTPSVSGQWGEMQLRRVVELAGMLPHCDFIEQSKSETSRLRPDMIIRLPGSKKIIVDAKAPINSYIEAINAETEGRLGEYVKNIRSHIKELGKKAYWEQFDYTPEFVLMFLPGEAFFSTAIKKDPSLIEFGVTENVIVTTPITLIALLKVVSFAWRQETVEKNAREIGRLGGKLVSVLEELFERSRKFEKKMTDSIDEYRKINSSIEEKIVPTAKKLGRLGLGIENIEG
jgi:DNA recombination protein RmuC